MITMVHQYELNSDIHVGGIDTWISDYLEFSDKIIRVIGVSESQGVIQDKHQLYAIMTRKQKKRIPISILFLIKILMNRELITNEIYVHRIDYVPFLRLIRPRAVITLFIHTDSQMQLTKNSDSFWKFIPKLYFYFERIALFLSSRVYVYSETDAMRIKGIKETSSQLKAWYNDNIFKRLNIPRDSDSCLWVGRFEQPKDPILAIKSFAKALEINPNLRLRLIGDGSLKTAMESEIAEHNLGGKVEIAGPKSQNELAIEMNSAGILLHTSEFEGSPRILLEALACGMRIVSNSNADPDRLSESFGNCATTRLPENVATALLEVQTRSCQDSELNSFLTKVAGSKVVGRYF